MVLPTSPLQGSAPRFEYPKQVWSPAGGWWANPRHWKRNTALGYCFIGTCLMFTFSYSAANERRPMPPTKHIPSQYWAKYASLDDPRLNPKGN